MSAIPCPALPSWPRPLRITTQPLPLQGRPGVAGVATGFGQITYTERTLEASDYFDANVRGQILFAPETVQDRLNPPFKGHAFWVNNRIVPRALDDLYEFQINLIATAQIAGAQLRVDAEVGSSRGPVSSDTQTLFNGALVPERVTFSLRVQVLGNFMANGCAFFLTSSVPLTVISETVLVVPVSIQPAP